MRKKKVQNKNRNNKAVETPSKKSVETPSKKAVETPSKEVEEPSKVVEEPSKVVEEPSKAVEEPSKVVEEPSKAVEEPSIVVEEQSEIQIMPTAVPTESKKVQAESIDIEEPKENNTKLPTREPSRPATNDVDATPDAPPEVPEDIKHPLENTWGFWLYTNENRKNWTENQKELTSFDTVEDYWCLYHYMKQPSELKQGQDYAVFKRGISPMWEDGANKAGGRWHIDVDRRGGEMDRIWLEVVLLMIGETFQNSDVVCGAVANVRAKNSRVSVWTRNKDEATNMEIGKKLKEMLRINYRLQFLDHQSNVALFLV